MNIVKVVRKNLVSTLIVAVILVGIYYYTTKKEGFQSGSCTITKPLGPQGGCLYLSDKGYKVINGNCVKQGNYRCPSGTIMSNDGNCYKCPSQTVLSGGKCKTKPSGKFVEPISKTPQQCM